MTEISSFVLKQVIDMFYNGHVMVGTEVKPHIIKALEMLKVMNIVVQTPAKHAEDLAQLAAAENNSKQIKKIFLSKGKVQYFSNENFDLDPVRRSSLPAPACTEIALKVPKQLPSSYQSAKRIMRAQSV